MGGFYSDEVDFALRCNGHSVRVASCRLVSPNPPYDVRSMARGDQASCLLDRLDKCGEEDVVLGGDMNWDDDLDGPFPIKRRAGWVDAWRALQGAAAGGCTYDSAANPMLRGFTPGRTRPDRFLCKLNNFTLDSVEMVGTQVIPDVKYYSGSERDGVPVLPSHRFGLLLTISAKQV